MTNISVTRKTKAGPAACWDLLADFANIDFFNPGVRDSYLLNGSSERGVGAVRQCNLTGGKNYIRERITDWQEGKSYTVSIYEGTMPLKNTFATLRVEPDGAGAILTMDMEYTPKFGPLGALMNLVMLRRMMEKSMHSVVQGLDEKVVTHALKVA